jgi:hypothetical protein
MVSYRWLFVDMGYSGLTTNMKVLISFAMEEVAMASVDICDALHGVVEIGVDKITMMAGVRVFIDYL